MAISTVSDAAERAAVTVACGAEPSVLLLAAGVVLHAGARPMIESIPQSRVATIAHSGVFARAALPGHRSDAAVSTYGIVITLLEKTRGFCQEGAGYDASDAR